MTLTLSPFGRELRYWRKLRGYSQLDLASQARTTPRHLSFLETGRSRPSAEMVERLSIQLTVPLHERNRLFESAGLSAPYTAENIDDTLLQPFRLAMQSMLDHHLPYPGMVVDRHWNIVRANATAQQMLDIDGENNLVRLLYVGAWRDLIENWEVMAWAGISRLQDDAARYPGDRQMSDLLDLAVGALEGVSRPRSVGSDVVMCPRFRFGDLVIPTISVVAQFGNPRDVTIDDLRIELIFPEDEVGRQFFEDMAV